MNTRKPQKMMALILSCILLSGLQVENIFANSGIIATSAGENGNDSENKNDSGDYYNQGEEVKAGSCGKVQHGHTKAVFLRSKEPER